MKITKEINGRCAVLRPDGWLDTPNADKFKAVLESLGSDITEIIIDMEKIEYISSAGLRLIVSAHKKVAGNLTVINASDEILNVLRMTGFDKRINIK